MSFFKTISLLILLQCIAATAWSHGGDYPKCPDELVNAISAPIKGAEVFARSLATQARGLFTKDQLQAIDRSLAHFNYSNGIKNNRYHDARQVDAEYNRWQGEKILCELVDSINEMLVFNFSPSAKLPDPHKVVPFDPQAAVLLLKTETGNKTKRFVVQSFNMDQERYQSHYEMPVEVEGVTYILQHLTQPSPDKSSTHIAFKKTDASNPFYWHALTLDVKPVGQLKMTIVDDKGKPIAAMVRLTALPSGKMYPPAGAIDYQPMINDVTGSSIDALPGMNIYGPGRGFEVRMPGEFAGHYWVVPDAIEMALPAGKWEVTVFRGIETIPLKKQFEIQEGKWTKEKIKLKRWVDMTSKGWYSGDDHIHSRMISSEDTDKMMAFTQAMDIRVSNILQMGDPQRTYYTQRGFGKEFRVSDNGYWLVPGQEDPRSILGHNIGLNLKAMARDLDRYLMLDWIADNVHAQGGLFGQTHVGQNACEAHRGMALMVPREKYDFYSIMQGGLGTQLYYDFLDLGYELTASAGSDTPYAGTPGNVRLYAYIDKGKKFAPDAWYDAIAKGHTFATNGPMIEFTVEHAIPGDRINVSNDKPLTVKAKAYGLQGQSAPVALQIVKLSEVIKTVKAENAADTELSVSFDIAPGDGFWIAARAYGANGSAAHTTPIYVKRSGLRHWNTGRADSLIDRQLAVLDEIEGVIAAAEQSKRDGTMIEVDYWAVRSIQQADAVRERLDISRNLYKELQAELKSQLK